ncbi:GH92 family glycosyl hydrolase [Flavihumibacter rivuli]|uniref:GH92 family glycosyl hydrolase n=1 Tax=Flavihumibacter rivuli TaxID=2838156 RepID=UPI001BDE387F|nr:GH92 family glycosyl hydrolase [Flavihumibacter rivuli]ULQ56973.1 GH92 family glycosyl hydrolase [Flavihumibacter rivuli]
MVSWLRASFSVLVLGLVTSCGDHQKEVDAPDLTSYVDPFIGTAAHGHVFLGANLPFGLVQLGPSNIFEGWDWCSGYNYSSNTIVGFSHMHLSGTGIGDLNDILVMPTTGKLYLNEGTKDNLEEGYLSTFSHDKEECQPGYYKVFLEKYKITAELTATERGGYHRYNYAQDDTSNVLLNLDYGVGWDKTVKAGVKKLNDSTIAGYRYSTGWATDQRIYFTAVFSQPILSAGIYKGDTLQAGEQLDGEKLKAVLKFAVKKDRPLEMKIALSPVSEANAAINLKEEMGGRSFDLVKAAAKSKWNEALSRISFNADGQTKKVFYTAMYHSMFAPSVFNDVNGDYLGTDKKVYAKAGFTNYTTFSLWDTYRALHPLYTITQPERVNDMVKTFLAIYQQQGRLPVWHLMGNETNTMNGNHSIPVMVDAYLKGFRDYDTVLAYEAIRKTAMQQRDGMNYIQQLKYIPADSLFESVANALEYAIDDWCVAQMARAMGKEDDYAYFTKRAELYKQYFDSNRQFMRGKLANGQWREPFDPFSSSHRKDDYVEGNAWQYTWLVPHDPHGLIGLFGGDKAFTNKLDSLFVVSGHMGKDASPDISGLIGQYAQGNEPNHHIPYLYAFAGEQWKTASLVRQIADTFYTAKPDGICGNEDLGQMSAWYIFSSMGFYPVNPANGTYVLGSPLMDKATIRLGGNKSFTIIAKNNSKGNKYIQKVEYNGKEYSKTYITHDMIRSGGELTLYMGPAPNKQWGVRKEDRPG